MPKPGVRYYYLTGPTEEYTEEWIRALGGIALNFAQLEGCAIWLIDAIGTEGEKSSIRMKQSFAHRNELAILLVLYKGLPAELVTEWVQLLGELNGAAGLRNKIFHNPSSVPNGKDFEVNDGIVLLKQGESIVLGLGDVQDYDTQLRELKDKMHSLLDRTRQFAVTASAKQ